jgi:hypothetical protein
MRNRLLHEALRDFALESAALLTDELRAGAEIEFDVIDEGGGRRGAAALYRYKPRNEAFIGERWARLRELPACQRAAHELGSGAALWLRVNGSTSGISGEQAEPALRALLERLYEDATSFGFPEERFERVYGEVETTLYHDVVRARVVAPLRGVAIDAERVDLGGGLSLVRGELADAPREAVWPEREDDDEPAVLCMLERDVPVDEGISAADAEERFAGLVTALRLWAPGFVSLGAPAWRHTETGRWQALPLGGGPAGPGAGGWILPAGEEAGLRDFFAAVDDAQPPRTVAWALTRFEMGCERGYDAEALSDYLLSLRALLDATSDAGEASLALRVAALCAEEGRRKLVQRRIEAAIALERYLMGGGPRARQEDESPRELVAEVEGHLRALLRDVLCGYLDADLKGVADDILLETNPEPLGEIKARDLRKEAQREAVEAEPEPDTSELEAVAPEPEPEPEPEPDPEALEPEREIAAEPSAPEPEPLPAAAPPRREQQPLAAQRPLEGVTQSDDWGWDDPADYSAPV